jgi:hypothetical protein
MGILLQVSLTSIRRIGTRTHPLTSVNIFAWWLMILSGIATIVTQGITWPKSSMIWGVLFSIGICGTLMVVSLLFAMFLRFGISSNPRENIRNSSSLSEYQTTYPRLLHS